LEIIYRPLDQLKFSPQSPRIHTDKQIRQIARSIEEFGFIVPVLVDHELCVFAGRGRCEAGELIGLKDIPTIALEHLTEPQLQAFRIADNRLTENASWDDKLLAAQLKALSEADLDFSVDITGFEVSEIDLLIEDLAPAPTEGPDPADMVPDVVSAGPISRTGDLWFLGRHRVYCGDSLHEHSFLTLMQDRRAAIVISDPPYNLNVNKVTGLGSIHHENFSMAAGEMTEREFTDFLVKVCTLLSQNSVNGSIHFLFMDWRHVGEIVTAGKQVYSELKNLCVWTKDNAGMGSLYRSQHELVFVFKNGKGGHQNNIQLGQYGRYRTNVWHYAGINSFARKTDEGNLLEFHPTVKPIGLVADAILDCSARGDVVLDPFLGSGTTVIAAERTGRVCYGIEIDPAYVDTIIRRWQSFTGLTAVHGISGRSFTELEQEVVNEHGQ
jgi:DNA modification methylase